MVDIEVYQKFETKINPQDLEIRVQKRDVSDEINKGDINEVNRLWNKLKLERGNKVFSKPKGLGSLYNISNKKAIFSTTDFKTYVAVSRSSENQTLSKSLYSQMRVAAIGAVVRTQEKGILVHKRSKDASHVSNVWDASVAGLAHIKDGNIDLTKTLYEKLESELNISKDKIIDVGVTGIHSARAPDYSGMYTFLVDTKLTNYELAKRAKIGPFEEFTIVPFKKLPGFIVNVFSKDDVSLDGVATLLASLRNKDYFGTIKGLRKKGKKIEFGYLDNGSFFKDKYLNFLK